MILRTRSGREVEIRALDWSAIPAPTANGWAPPSDGGNQGYVIGGVPAATRAVTVAGEAVAQLEFRVWRGEGIERRRVLTTWQSRFFAGVPNEREPWPALWQQTEECLTSRRNAYWWKETSDGRVESVILIPPGACTPKMSDGRKVFDVRFDRSGSRATRTQTVGTDRVLHFRGSGGPGSLAAPSPFQEHRDRFNAARAKTRYEAGFYERGTGQSIAAVFPETTTPAKADEWRAMFTATHGGVENQHKVRVFGGGVQLHNIGVTLEDSQYIESMRFDVEEVARILGVPPYLLYAEQRQGRGATPEQEDARWWKYGLGPRCVRIRSSIQADPSFFGPGSRDYAMFDADDVVQGDILTETQTIHMLVQSGVLTPDEGRAKLGLPPHPGGVGKIPQIVPVGGAPNPKPPGNPPVAPDTEE